MAKIKLFDPVIGIEEETAVKKTLDSHFWSSGFGTGKVKEFEEKFNRYVGSKKCIAVNSGSAALHLALSLADIKNKEVILPSLTFVSTAHAVRLNGGKPVFADIDPNTLCLDVKSINKAITKKTKVILPVHFGGMAANISEIKKICNEKNFLLIEDAAHATGSSFKNKKIGSHGFAVCHSFNPTKNLVMPAGGAITLNGKNVEKLSKLLFSKRWCGIFNRIGTKYDVTDIGWSYFMNEFSAAIGLEQLKKIEKLIKKRKEIGKKYHEGIKQVQKMSFEKNCSYHLFWIQVNNRDQFMKQMLENGIETGIHFQPVHTMTYYKTKYKLPVTETVGKKIVSLPMHPNLTEKQIEKVIKLTNKFAK